MRNKFLYTLILLLFAQVGLLQGQKTDADLSVNYAYSPKWWQTNISLPESPRKVVIGKEGQLFYEYPKSVSESKFTKGSGFNTVISFKAGENEEWKSQKLYRAEIPVVITEKELNNVIVTEEAFVVTPLLFGSDDASINNYLGSSLNKKITGTPGNDMVLITIENKGSNTATFSPSIQVSSKHQITIDTAKGKVFISDFLRVVIPYSISSVNNVTQKSKSVYILSLKPIQIGAGEKIQLAFGVSQGHAAIDCPNNLEQALLLRKQSIAWWEKASLPFNKIVVPDKEIQNLLNASIRNIYQASEIENELLALNTGAFSNREVHVSDAPFIADALILLNNADDAERALNHILLMQKNDGSFLQQEKDWKGTGFVLWSIASYARLTGDKEWLESVWPKLEKGFNFLIDLQKNTLQSKAAYAGLLPPGNGSEGQSLDYVNNYWALAGLNSAITAARWVGRNGQAIKWQSLYDTYYKAFLESGKKNMKKDTQGNSYLPVRLPLDKKTAPQKSQWAFLNAVYPGKIFDINDPVLTGNMKMLAGSTKEGLIFNSGWMNNSVVLTTGSDYAHALQWTGYAQDAARVMYALANHAAPNFSWYEQQQLKESKDTLVSGDMPNSRVSAEFIRLVRHLIAIERNYELHLMEGVPAEWTKPGMEIKLDNVLTEFGTLTFNIRFSEDGKKATLNMNLDTTNRRIPQRILLHLDGISGNPAVIELELKPNLQKVLTLN